MDSNLGNSETSMQNSSDNNGESSKSASSTDQMDGETAENLEVGNYFMDGVKMMAAYQPSPKRSKLSFQSPSSEDQDDSSMSSPRSTSAEVYIQPDSKCSTNDDQVIEDVPTVSTSLNVNKSDVTDPDSLTTGDLLPSCNTQSPLQSSSENYKEDENNHDSGTDGNPSNIRNNLSELDLDAMPSTSGVNSSNLADNIDGESPTRRRFSHRYYRSVLRTLESDEAPSDVDEEVTAAQRRTGAAPGEELDTALNPSGSGSESPPSFDNGSPLGDTPSDDLLEIVRRIPRSPSNRVIRPADYEDSDTNGDGDGDGDDSSTSSHNVDNFSGDSDSDMDSLPDPNNPEYERRVQEILSVKPVHRCGLNFLDIIWRQHGLLPTNPRALEQKYRELRPHEFVNNFYGSLYAVERMELMCNLDRHRGCVNCLNFNQTGDLIVSGSDDLHVIVWRWAKNEVAMRFHSGNTMYANLFQVKFFDYDGLNVITSSRDGHIFQTPLTPSGDTLSNKCLYIHEGAVHKISVSPRHRYEILSAGEDGKVFRYDFREGIRHEVVKLKRPSTLEIPLYSIASHPNKQEFCVSGRDTYVHVYDERNSKHSVNRLYPKDRGISVRASHKQITCAVYNHDGTEVLASYSDEDIYLFDNTNSSTNPVKKNFSGHRNSKTIKGVSFFGPRSEYVISGSDCGHIYFWERDSAAIVNWIPGDIRGVVNCLEPHPTIPVLATSGLDDDVKIWLPTKEKEPEMNGLERCLRQNISYWGLDSIFDRQGMRIFSHGRWFRRLMLDTGLHEEFEFSSQDSSSSEDRDPERGSRNYGFRSLSCSPS